MAQWGSGGAANVNLTPRKYDKEIETGQIGSDHVYMEDGSNNKILKATFASFLALFHMLRWTVFWFCLGCRFVYVTRLSVTAVVLRAHEVSAN